MYLRVTLTRYQLQQVQEFLLSHHLTLVSIYQPTGLLAKILTQLVLILQIEFLGLLSKQGLYLYTKHLSQVVYYEYLKDTYYDRVDAAYYNNAVAIALAAKYKSDKDVNEEQIKHLQASIKELNALADKHNWDKETYRKQVEGMIERWEQQTFNERIGLGLEFGEKIVDMLYKGRKKRTNTKTKSTTTETYTESH